MTDKETEIKALAATIFELKAKLANIGMMNVNGTYEEINQVYQESTWIKFQLEIAEQKLKAASI